MDAITIIRGDDTDFNGANFLTINISTEILDLTTFKAEFILGNVIKTFTDLSSGSINVNLTAAETQNLPPIINGILRLIDEEKRIATIESLIPFKVVSIVDGNAIATQPYTLNFDVTQGGETILTVNVESAVSVEVGSTTTLPAGSSATVINSGSGNHLVLDFGIPKGADGQDGQNGQDGRNGTDGADATINGVSTLTLTANYGLTLTQSGNTANISGKDITDVVDGISAVIPSAATEQNQLADKAFVTGQGYITTSALSGYATENFVTSQGYITGINSTDVTNALGFTPYNSSNPDGFITSSALTNYQEKATITTLSATDSITLADNTIYNGNEQTSLTIAPPSSATVDFIAQINFSSGATATTITSSDINFVGDDTASNVFTPIENKRYTVVVYFDGVNFVGVAKGI